jgi:hypothetical protein
MDSPEERTDPMSRLTYRYGVVGWGGWKNWLIAASILPWRLNLSVKLDWRDFLIGWDFHNWISEWSFHLHPLPMLSFGLIYRYKQKEKVGPPWLADARLQKK